MDEGESYEDGLVRIASQCNVSKTAMCLIYAHHLRHAQYVADHVAAGLLPRHYRTIQRQVAKTLPNFATDMYYKEKGKPDLCSKRNLVQWPKKLIAQKQMTVFAEVGRFTLPMAIDWYRKWHGADPSSIRFQDDDFAFGPRSNHGSITVISCQFDDCSAVIPLIVYVPHEKLGSLTEKMNLEWGEVIDDCNESDLLIKHLTADGAKRCCLLGLQSTNGRFNCLVCAAKTVDVLHLDSSSSDGASDNDEGDGGRAVVGARKNVKYAFHPETSLHHPMRKSDDIYRKAQSVAAGHQRPGDPDLEGVKFLSPIWRLRQRDEQGIPRRIDLAEKLPTDIMHCLCLGLIKCAVDRTIDDRDVARRKVKPVRSETLHQEMQSILLPSETSRRVRKVYKAKLTGEEYLYYGLLFFPAVVKFITDDPTLKSYWYTLAAVLRFCVVPDNEFLAAKSPAIFRQLCHQLFRLHVSVFGAVSGTYNAHAVTHLWYVRKKHGCLTKSWAFASEKLYGRLKRFAYPGTAAIAKQMLTGFLLESDRRRHKCERKLFFRSKTTRKTADNLLYVFTSNKYEFYQVDAVTDGRQLRCKRIHTLPYIFHEPVIGSGLLSALGVFQFVRVTDDIRLIDPSKVAGKAVIARGAILSLPKNVLTSL